MVAVDWDCGCRTARIQFKGANVMGQESIFRLAPLLGGYGPNGGASLSTNVPFGVIETPFSTIYQDFHWHDTIEF